MQPFILKLVDTKCRYKEGPMRYYDLDTNGKVKGHYAVPQPGKALYLLEDTPNEESKRNTPIPGSTWVPDQEKIDIRLAKEAKAAASIMAKATLKNTQIGNLNTVGQVCDAMKLILDVLEIEYKH